MTTIETLLEDIEHGKKSGSITIVNNGREREEYVWGLHDSHGCFVADQRSKGGARLVLDATNTRPPGITTRIALQQLLSHCQEESAVLETGPGAGVALARLHAIARSVRPALSPTMHFDTVSLTALPPHYQLPHDIWSGIDGSFGVSSVPPDHRETRYLSAYGRTEGQWIRDQFISVLGSELVSRLPRNEYRLITDCFGGFFYGKHFDQGRFDLLETLRPDGCLIAEMYRTGLAIETVIESAIRNTGLPCGVVTENVVGPSPIAFLREEHPAMTDGSCKPGEITRVASLPLFLAETLNVSMQELLELDASIPARSCYQHPPSPHYSMVGISAMDIVPARDIIPRMENRYFTRKY